MQAEKKPMTKKQYFDKCKKFDNLRNKVAHGLAEMSLFKKSIADMVIYLFFCLTNYAWPDKDGNEI